MASSRSCSRPPGNHRYTLARETPASRATSSTVILASSTRTAHRTVAASTSSRDMDGLAISGVVGATDRGLPRLLASDTLKDQRVTDDRDLREDEPLHRVAEVGTVREHRIF